MARSIRKTQNELTVSTGGSSDWRSLDNELTETGLDADESSASTGQKIADGFEKDYAIGISSLLTPVRPKPFRSLPNDIPKKRTKDFISNSRSEGHSTTAHHIKHNVNTKDSEGPKAALIQDTLSRGLADKKPYPLYPSQPTSDLNITAELRKLWDKPTLKPHPFPRLPDSSIKPNIKEPPSLNDRARFHNTTKTNKTIPNPSSGRSGSSRFGARIKHIDGTSDTPRAGRRRFHPNSPSSPIHSDMLYDDGTSSIIHTSTGICPPIAYGSRRVVASTPGLPLPHSRTEGHSSDGIHCPRPSSQSCNVPDTFWNGWDHCYNSSKIAYPAPVQLFESDTTTSKFADSRPSKQGLGSIPRPRAPLRDLSSNGLKIRDTLGKEAQTRRASLASSQKENLRPRKRSRDTRQNSPIGGGEDFTREVSEIFTNFADTLTGNRKVPSSPASDSNTGHLGKQATRFHRNKSNGNHDFLSSTDVSSNLDSKHYDETGTVVRNPETSLLPFGAPDTTADTYAGDKLRRSLPRTARFSRSRYSTASITDFHPAGVDLTLTVSTDISSTPFGQGATVDNTHHREPDKPLDMLSDLQSRLQRLEIERESLNQSIRQLNRENLALSARVQVLEAAKSTGGVGREELNNEDLSMHILLQPVGKGKRSPETQAQMPTSGVTGLCGQEATDEKTCRFQDETDVLEATDLSTRTANAGESVDPICGSLGEAHVDYTILTLVDDHEVEELRRSLEASRIDRTAGKIHHISSAKHDISMPPLSQVLANIGVGVEKEEYHSSASEEDMCTLPPIKKWVRRGLQKDV
ncbi:hypothetical protein TRV_04305 [Trichophyton verrucosum HKI 0517]|uniref:Uncharacterized protein n=1 Tax=Trichophyton verrucosum (strain HKI 0517) TaxID=663202 RepID=D4DB06_TRIVH|nr:uncharacterized protein TRV_04305 [Trichophyton verrucosum HKI 0517]EFE40945.1 hypothetical protein TRV_04305 [Trichophyton verrucosum HKI 0517]